MVKADWVRNLSRRTVNGRLSAAVLIQLLKTDGIQGFQFGDQKKDGRPVPGNNGASRVRN